MIIKLLVAGALVYGALLTYMVVFQRHFLYFPARDLESPGAYGLSGMQPETITTADGVKLTLWHQPARARFPTILYLHGNAGHLGYRSGIFKALLSRGFGLVALSWRGYGTSEGSPSEQGLYADARAALNFAQAKLGLAPKSIILFGESLGSGVAVQLGTECEVGLVVLEAPYTAVADRAADIYFYIPVKLLMSDRYESWKKIAALRAPLLILHGEDDVVIPVAHGRALLERAHAPKRGIFYPGIGHSNFDFDTQAQDIERFARELGLVQP